jgi:hypothetical protein
MRFLNLINYLIDICWSGQDIMILFKKPQPFKNQILQHLAYDQDKVDKYESFKISSRWSRFNEKRQWYIKVPCASNLIPKITFYLFIYLFKLA